MKLPPLFNRDKKENPAASQNSGNEAQRSPERRRPISAQERLDRLSRSVLIGTFVAVIAVGFGIVSSVSSQVQVARVTGNMRPAVTSVRAIAAGETISSDMVTVTNIPASYLSEGATSDVSAYVGHTASVSIPANTQLSSSQVASAANASSLSAKIPVGYVASTVNVSSDTGLSTLIKCGDTVQVYATRDNEETVYQIAADIPVLALDGHLSGPTDGETYATVTLQVSESQAEEIATAQISGKITLLLNPLSTSK